MKQRNRRTEKRASHHKGASRNPKKGGGVLCGSNAVKYAWIEMQQKSNEFNVDAMCEMLEVNRSGYYAHKKAVPSVRQKEDERLTKLIIKFFNESRQNYGTQRIQRDLRDWGENVSRRRIGQLMKSRLGMQNHEKV